jgi:hypothetical protein
MIRRNETTLKAGTVSRATLVAMKDTAQKKQATRSAIFDVKGTFVLLEFKFQPLGLKRHILPKWQNIFRFTEKKDGKRQERFTNIHN